MADRQQLPREDLATRVAGGAFLTAILAAAGLGYIYFVAGGQTQLEGTLLAIAFAGIAVGVTVWTKAVIDEDEVTEERPPMRSTEAERQGFRRAWEGTRPEVADDPRNRARRRFLTRLLVFAGGSLGAVLLLPFRSLGPSPQQSLFNTDWSEGDRLVSFEGRPIRPERLTVGGVATVFPEGRVGDADSQAVLIHVGEQLLELPEGSPPTVDGFVVYSKICTHAGCQVGLYRSEVGQLLCPCHQSRFDVYHGAQPISGPTVRPLPQLPLGLDDEGYFVALGDFEVPVGPGFWNLPEEGEG